MNEGVLDLFDVGIGGVDLLRLRLQVIVQLLLLLLMVCLNLNSNILIMLTSLISIVGLLILLWY